MSLLGVDVGTTGCKAIAFREEGELLSQGYREYPLHHSKPGWMELDAALVWDRTREAIREAVRGTQKDPVRAVAVSSLGEGIIPVSKEGRALAPAILGFDPRGVEAASQLQRTLGEERMMALTGMPLSSGYSLPKLMWWKDNQTKLFEEAHRFLCFQDWTAMKLGAEPSIDLSLAGRTLCLDVTTGRWCEEILETAEVPSHKLPKPVPSGTIIGEVTQEAANDLGLPVGVQIVAGGHDQPAGCLGCGVVEPGLAMDATGTVECIAVALAKPVLNEQMRKHSFCCYRHVVPDQFLTLAFNWTGGSILKWFRDALGADSVRKAKETGRDVYDVLLKEMPSEPTELLVLPYFGMSGTPYFDEEAKGAVLGLTLETTQGQLLRAFLEGVTMEMRFNLDLLEEAGVSVGSLRAIGGGAKSRKWLQLKADVFGRPVDSLNVTEAACLGMAVMAGVATGSYTDAKEGVQTAIQRTKRYEPHRERAAAYDERMKVYAQLYAATKPLIQGLKGTP